MPEEKQAEQVDENMPKKKWKAPQLIVLVRARPEEAILTGCKDTSGPSGPGANLAGCYYFINICSGAGCSAQTPT